jgi:hypothetical protein
MRRRPYLFEIIALLNAAWVFAVTWDNAVHTIAELAFSVAGAAVLSAIAGVALRCLIAWRRGNLRHYLAIIGSRAWLIDSVRITVGLSLLALSYTWIKLLVPIFHPVLYDQALFDLDRAVCLGIAPSVFLLNLFSDPRFLHFIDHAYAWFFLGGMVLSYAMLFSAASRRVRVTFMTSTVLMWLAGAWLYMLIPSLGPAYAFADIWMPFGKDLPITQSLQAKLMANYRGVLEMARGREANIFPMFGIAAFPSLHIATQTLVAVWMRRVWPAGQVVFGFAAFFVFIGSMITGWHYLIDGVAALALSFGSYGIAVWSAKKEFRPS